MSKVNMEMPHLAILPEDTANHQIASEFSMNNTRIGVLSAAGGWRKVISKFENIEIDRMKAYPNRWIVLLIDFDADERPKITYEERLKFAQERLNGIKEEIPDDLKERVFILGSLSEPERLKSAFKCSSFSCIGEKLADDCANNTNEFWGHELLRHNKQELDRMIKCVKPFLFPN